MSAEQLSKLSLGDTMVTTRAGAAKARASPSMSPQHASTPSPTSPTSPVAPSPTPSLVESAHGLKYNLSPFDDDVRRRAKRGLMDDNDIKMKYCRASATDPREYLFYIDDDITVAIGGKRSTPKCSCGLNEGGKACKHIFWMLDHLTTGAPAKVKSQTLQLAEDGSSVQSIRPAEMIDKSGIENVAEGLEWPLQEGPLPEEEDEMVDEIAEILSVFEPSDTLPVEFKRPESPFLSERARKYREFKDIITQHAWRNPALFIQLQSLIDPSFRALVFFEKINDRIARTFRGLDDYMANGPTDAPSEAHDVVNCATKLKALVKAIADYCYQQDEDNPDTKDVANRATTALIGILDGVASRNFDAYANITWGGIPPTDIRKTNLFVCLIGDPAEDDGLFVLDTLGDLPQDDVLRNHWEAFLNIGDRLKQSWTPVDYINAFRSITQETRKRAASETGGSSAKRPAQ